MLLAISTLASCIGRGGEPPPDVPLPAHVPTQPVYRTADAIVETLDDAGMPCEVLRRRGNPYNQGSGLDCALDGGITFVIEISVSDPATYDRDALGTSVDSRRRGTAKQTVVVAGNWLVNVQGLGRSYAPRIADALGGVVLEPIGKKPVPEYPLPEIPDHPRYANVHELADALDSAAGCTSREEMPTGPLKCDTGSAATRDLNCATLFVVPDTKTRDLVLRDSMKWKGVPKVMVSAGNWVISLCDYSLGTRVAQALNGTLVTYDGN
ncbi:MULTISPECIES: hypothetical protein [Streptomyces]|uniref:hypothetical protein n=1 Tax=Streptomyces TaxID=1883 RepID=UPI0022490983|nr:hypothetical protein [Streptomyces sp. JHD 1]MCX2971072.1 hypothetical protein [Streptomyces sp. JHD 1]